MARPRKKPPNLELMAEEVSNILQGWVEDGYPDQVAKVRRFIEASGQQHVANAKVNIEINNQMAKRLKAAEQALKRAGLPVPDSIGDT